VRDATYLTNLTCLNQLHIALGEYIRQEARDPAAFIVSEEGRVIHENYLKELQRWEQLTALGRVKPAFTSVRKAWFVNAMESYEVELQL
jgi:hypothetical protein